MRVKEAENPNLCEMHTGEEVTTLERVAETGTFQKDCRAPEAEFAALSPVVLGRLLPRRAEKGLQARVPSAAANFWLKVTKKQASQLVVATLKRLRQV